MLLEVFDAAVQLFDSESLLLDFVVFLPQKLHLLLVDLFGSSALPAHCRQVLLFLSQFVLDVLSEIFFLHVCSLCSLGSEKFCHTYPKALRIQMITWLGTGKAFCP